MTQRTGRQGRPATKSMDASQRLALIVEAVNYCKRVKALGMPANCYTKSLREPIYFLWEAAKGSKAKIATYRSRAAVGLSFGRRELQYDHAVPFRYLQDALLGLDPVTPDAVASTLAQFGTTAIITSAENDRLTAAGLRDKMPRDWDRADQLARYRAVGIELESNGDEVSHRDA